MTGVSRTFVTLMAGAFLGVLLSPISLWLLLHGEQFSPVQLQQPYLSCGRSLTLAVPTERNTSGPPVSQPRYQPELGIVNKRKLVYTAVLATPEGIRARGAPIYRTWGQQLGKHFGLYLFPEEHSTSETKRIDGVTVNLVNTNSTGAPPRYLQKLLLLQHLLETTPSVLLEYEFVLLTGDDLFVHWRNLRRLLQSISPTSVLYIGRVYSRDSRYCLGNPGILLSQAALTGLRNTIGRCLKMFSSQILPYESGGDETLGKCLQSSLGLHCTQLNDEGYFYQYSQDRILYENHLQQLKYVLEKAVTIHPVLEPTHFYHIHQMIMEHDYKQQMEQASNTVISAERVSDHLQANSSLYKKHWWLWHTAHVNPKTRYEINAWQYFNSSNLFNSQEHQPMINLPIRVKNSINTALEVIVKRTNASDNKANRLLPPYNLVDGFLLTDESWGFEYVLHMSVKKPSIKTPVKYFAHVYFPLQGTSMSFFRPFERSSRTTINLIVPVPKHHTLLSFLEFFETECLNESNPVHLHLVFFEHDEPMTTRIRHIQRIYRAARITIHEIKGYAYSPSFAYNYVSTRLAGHELMVLFDMNLHFTSEFLHHCRMNTIEGRQAYSPILFTFYKPDLVQRYAQKKDSTLISTNTGFFLRYNYQVLALYNSDFHAVGGFRNLRGSGSDDIRFISKLLRSDVYVMRALEPYLRKQYKPRTCKGLKNSAKIACLNSMADSVGSKKILGTMVASKNLI